MTSIKDGGPAFPGGMNWHPKSGDPAHQTGMTLRDWFAGQALSNPRTFPADWMCTQDIADQAYAIADAMISARSKGDQS